MHYFRSFLACTFSILIPLFFHPNWLNTHFYPNQIYLTVDQLSRARLPNTASYQRASLHNAVGHYNIGILARCSVEPYNPPVLQSPSFPYWQLKPNHSLLWSLFVHWGELSTILGLNLPSNSSSSSSSCEESGDH